jgi:hypothetical protein
MVNRFLRKHRMNEVGDFTSEEASAALDCINDAKEEVLDTRMWKFDQREGVLTTFLTRTAVDTGTFTNGNAVVIGTTTLDATIDGTHTLRAVPTGSSDRAQTAHQVNYAGAIAGVLSLGLDANFSGTTGSYATTLFAAEYQWPAHSNGDTQVRHLLSMTHQERPLRLVEIDKNFRFDSLVTRLHDSLGDDPEVVYYSRPTISTASIAGTPNTRPGCIIWPVPITQERLDYTYIYAHAPLTAVTDTLVEVPERVLNAIVELAYGFSLNTQFGNDPMKADRVITAANIRIGRLYDAERPMPYKAKPLRSLDNMTRDTRHNWYGRRIPWLVDGV